MAPIDRRQQVIHAAAQSFAMFGYKATTMDQVAKIANVGKGTIYTFFTNKEQLFDQILVEVIQEMKNIAQREVHQESAFLIICFVYSMRCWNSAVITSCS